MAVLGSSSKENTPSMRQRYKSKHLAGVRSFSTCSPCVQSRILFYQSYCIPSNEPEHSAVSLPSIWQFLCEWYQCHSHLEELSVKVISGISSQTDWRQRLVSLIRHFPTRQLSKCLSPSVWSALFSFLSELQSKHWYTCILYTKLPMKRTLCFQPPQVLWKLTSVACPEETRLGSNNFILTPEISTF